MKIMIVDDEERARNMLEIILKSMGYTDLVLFGSAENALDYLKANDCDTAFLDVEMPGMDGLELAEELLKLPNPPAVIFETAYRQYAVRAWDSDAVDYLLKPFCLEQVRRALARASRRIAVQKERKDPAVEIHCFPTFGLWVDGIPLSFDNRKAKELLAFLVHMQGAWVSTDRIVYALFEDSDEKSAKNYYRLVLYRLKRILKEIGLEDLVESGYGKARVNPAMFSCDYYRYLQGERDLFFGEYMSDYDWAEQTLADLRRKTTD